MTRLHRSQYTVGWICAVSIELAAARAILDEIHEEYSSGDYIFTLGSIGGHNIVISCLPAGQLGISPAAIVASRTLAEFPQIRFGLMVGIGGGVPGHDGVNDVRLGDVVVSQPQGYYGGVIQYDSGKATPDGFERTTQLDSPPTILLSALNLMKAKEAGGFSNFHQHIARLENDPRRPIFRREKAGEDILFHPDYDHPEGSTTCANCSKDKIVQREQREKGNEVSVHYGNIASGNQVIRYARERDRISQLLGGILCYEMEAAGLMNHFKCLVIRGICDYADSHKNKKWQPYASATAAAYAKELLLTVPTGQIQHLPTANEPLGRRPMTPPYQQQQIVHPPRNPEQLGEYWSTSPNPHANPIINFPDIPPLITNNNGQNTATRKNGEDIPRPTTAYSDQGPEPGLPASPKTPPVQRPHSAAEQRQSGIDIAAMSNGNQTLSPGPTHKVATKKDHKRADRSKSISTSSPLVDDSKIKDQDPTSARRPDPSKSGPKRPLSAEPTSKSEVRIPPPTKSTDDPVKTKSQQAQKSTASTSKPPEMNTASASKPVQKSTTSASKPAQKNAATASKLPQNSSKEEQKIAQPQDAKKNPPKTDQSKSTTKSNSGSGNTSKPKNNQEKKSPVTKVSPRPKRRIPRLHAADWETPRDFLNAVKRDTDFVEGLKSSNPKISELLSRDQTSDVPEILLYLLQSGLDPNNIRYVKTDGEKFYKLFNPHMWVLTKEWEDVGRDQLFQIVKHLADHGADVANYRVASGATAVHQASGLGYVRIFAEILKRGGDINCKIKALTPSDRDEKIEDNTPLMLAAFNGHLPLMKYILHNYAATLALEARQLEFGDTALSLACIGSQRSPNQHLLPNVIELLLQHGANVNAEDKLGNKIIHVAALNGREEAVRLLIKYGAKVDARGHNGQFPIVHAVRKGHVKVVKVILENGGCSLKVCEEALEVAKKHERRLIADLLRKEIAVLTSKKG